MSKIQAAMGSMHRDELLSNLSNMSANMLHRADTTTEAWGVKVTRIEIKDIAPIA